ncbi:MAG TPA: glycoside hydrolase family 9 protein [Opitutus sp.]|nr:glycoside hydrolase family 9 protein [Opitutus sp.]
MKHLIPLLLGAAALAAAGKPPPPHDLPATPGHIHVDQFGYLPNEDKIAVLSDPQAGFNARDHFKPGRQLELRRATDDSVVLQDAPVPFDAGQTDALSGDRGWWFDFTPVTAPGRYYIFDPATHARSPEFRIAPDVFADVLRAAVRVFYYQREGTAHVAPWADAPWQDGPSFLQDSEARAIASPDDPATARDLSRGWQDAGDTNKYPTFLGEVIHPLLYAWTAHPAVFTDDFNIPESGNGLPDLLDEVKWELDWLAKMQDADGGVFIKMGMAAKKQGDWPEGRAVSPLSQDLRPRYYGPKCSASTIAAAGVFAHAARVYAGFAPWKAYAADLRRRAERAWQWYVTHPRSYDCDNHAIMSGLANLTAAEQDAAEAVAAMHLWVLTGENRYHDAFRNKVGTLPQLAGSAWSYYRMGQAEVLFDYLRQTDADTTLSARISGTYARAIHSPQFMPQDGRNVLYRAWMPAECYHWGSNRTRCCFGIAALGGVDYFLGGAERDRLRQRAIGLLHSLHGVNPLDLVYLTNMGCYGATTSVQHVYHEWFGAQPPPGYLAGGPNRFYDGNLAWIRQQPPGKAYVDTSDGGAARGYELTEPAIYYQACYVRLLAAFVTPPPADAGTERR